MKLKTQNNLFNKFEESFCKVKVEFCKYVEDLLKDKVVFNYIEDLDVRDANSKLTGTKLYVGQKFNFDFSTKNIVIEDYKILENRFCKIKNYGPYSFETLGFSFKDDTFFILTIISYLKFCKKNISSFENYPKYVIANKDSFGTKTEYSLNNLLKLWKLDDINFPLSILKDMENQIFPIFNKILKKLNNQNILNKKIIEEYFCLIDLLNDK